MPTPDSPPSRWILMTGDELKSALGSMVINSKGETMATPKTNGRNLEEALAILINNQAQFVGRLAHMDAQFAEIRTELAEIKNILIHHQQTLDDLPEAIREKIGFKSK